MGGGFHLVGDSSSGKSTALSCGASVWGGPGFVRTWRATANGLERIAAALNDTALVLDEISEADPRELGSVIYAIENGTGKSRANRTGNARAVRRWRVMLLSSGERTLSATMTEGGKRTKAGQEARLLDVPCARRFGLFDTLHDAPNGRALSDTLRTAAAHHGHAGPALVERLVSDPGVALAAIQARPEFAAETSLEGRAAGAFALAALAGDLATDYRITGWPEGEALTAAATAYQAWTAHRGKGRTETRQILEAISDFISRHADARFSHVLSGDGPLIRDRAGWHRDTDEARVYLFTRAGLREAAGGFDFRRVLDALDAEGWLVERDKDKRSKATKVQGRTEHLYAIAPRDLE
jgi:putative DNA primase/helicase